MTTKRQAYKVIDGFGNVLRVGSVAAGELVEVNRLAGERLVLFNGEWIEKGAYAGPGAIEEPPAKPRAASPLTPYGAAAEVEANLRAAIEAVMGSGRQGKTVLIDRIPRITDYAAPPNILTKRTKRTRNWIVAVGALTIALALIISAFSAYDAGRMSIDAARIRADATIKATEMRLAAPASPPAPAPTINVIIPRKP
jgi:hypothetical protein